MAEINMHAWSVNFWLALEFWFSHACIIFDFVQTADEEYGYYNMIIHLKYTNKYNHEQII